jgi:hypothetical protein
MTHCLWFDRQRKLLRLAFAGHVSEPGYLSAYEDVVAFMQSNGPCSTITDFSAADRFDVSTAFAREIGEKRPMTIPSDIRRVVVAPQPAIYGTARIMAARREGSRAEIRVTRSLASAYAAFGTDGSKFVEVRREGSRGC